METIILELLSLVTLLFTVLSLIFSFSEVKIFLLFIYVLAVCSLFALKKLQGRWLILLPMVLIMPFFLEITWENGFLTGIYTLSLLYYFVRGLGKLYHEDLMGRFKIFYALMILIAILGLLIPRFNGWVLRSIPYMLLYFFVTIILSTSLRHQAAGIGPKKNRQRLFLYLSLALIFSIIFGLSQVRAGIFIFLSILGKYFKQVLFLLINPVIFGISWVFVKILGLISVPLNMEYEEEEVLGQIEGGITKTAKFVKESPLIELFFTLIVGVIILFLAYRFIKAMTEKKIELPYEEQRDFIIASTDKTKRNRRDKLPSDPKGQLRYYYRQYLRQLNKKIPLEKQDTSQSIEEKGRDIFKQNEEIRNLYIKYRYTDLEVSGEVVEDMKNLTIEK